MSTAIGHGLVGPETWGKPVRAIHGLDDFGGKGGAILLSFQYKAYQSAPSRKGIRLLFLN